MADGTSKHNKKEIFFILGILLLAVCLWIWLRIFGIHSAPTIRITVDGEEFGVYSLAVNQTISIGETNVCEILGGSVRMISATCPDHLCIHQGAIDEKGGIIVCLPNRVVIEGGNAVSPSPSGVEIDAVQ